MAEHNRRSTDRHGDPGDHEPGACPGGCEEISEVQMRLTDGHERMCRIETQLSEVYEIVQMGKGFFKMLGIIATVLKWIAAIVGPFVAIYFAITGHSAGAK